MTSMIWNTAPALRRKLGYFMVKRWEWVEGQREVSYSVYTASALMRSKHTWWDQKEQTYAALTTKRKR
jgi:hypothetical protein